MKKSFPASYPYLNSKGLVLTKKDVDSLASTALASAGAKGHEFGLELAYVMLWAMEKADTLEKASISINTVFKRIVYTDRRYQKPKHMKTEELSDFNTAFLVYDHEDRILRRLDGLQILGTSLATLAVKQRRRDRLKTLEKLKAKFEGDG